MAFNENLAERLRKLLKTKKGITEKKMLVGLPFFLTGNMSVGVNKNDIIVRVNADQHEELLKRPGTRTFDLTGKPMLRWILVDAEDVKSDTELKWWGEIGLKYAGPLPKKSKQDTCNVPSVPEKIGQTTLAVFGACHRLMKWYPALRSTKAINSQ